MKITLNKAKFLDFLDSIARITNLCSVNLTKTAISSIAQNVDGTLILITSTLCNCDQDFDKITIDLPNVGKLIKMVKFIEADEFDFIYDDNNLKYKDSKIRFTYHLLESGIASVPQVNVQKIKALKWDTSFNLTYRNVVEVIRASTVIQDCSKVYITCNQDTVIIELDDKSRDNVDNFTLTVNTTLVGTELTDPVILPFDTIRIIAATRSEDIKIKINSELGVTLFDISDDHNKFLYIAASLIK